MARTYYMARDQHGETIHGLVTPRKDLLERLGRKHADKMYVDTKDGRTLHIGYIVGHQWFTIYKVERMENAS